LKWGSKVKAFFIPHWRMQTKLAQSTRLSRRLPAANSIAMAVAWRASSIVDLRAPSRHHAFRESNTRPDRPLHFGERRSGFD